MKIKIEFQCEGYGNYWESALTDNGETPEQCANRIVDNFNKTRHPGEEVRHVLGVRISPEANINHQWEKQNNFTIVKGRRNFDIYKCKNCKVTGKRYGLDGSICVDYKFRKKVYCNLI